jgi:hypothetical protein
VSLRSNARTAQTYLAGLGASGALIAGAIVVFLMLIAVVTFDAWPGAGGLFGDDSETIEVTAPEPPDAAAQAAGSALAPATLVVSAQPLEAAVPVTLPGSVEPGDGGLGGGELVTFPPALSPGAPPSPPAALSGPTSGGGGGGGEGEGEVGRTVRNQVNRLGQAVGNVAAAVPVVVDHALGAVDNTVDHTLNTVHETLNKLAPRNRGR